MRFPRLALAVTVAAALGGWLCTPALGRTSDEHLRRAAERHEHAEHGGAEHDGIHLSHAHHDHEGSGPEFGISVGYVRLEEDDESAVGLHLHLLKPLSDEGRLRKVAAGVGTEVIFAEHEHYAGMVSFAVNPWRGLVLSVSPGVLWAEHEGDLEAEYATHVEAAYVVPVHAFDVGPALDYSRTSSEAHYTIGFHVGVHF